ncbi:MAG TPA: hypothetical protein PLX62_08385 [Bacteroidales bacterium]|jgi:hypothetical protein|nr:MAG: hypothetical protein BWY89_01415 [Bacteroidetes bacterium ADurb.BinA012]HNV66536.1 hypothetical protein [Bacteroidales bacterium]HQB52906.1 hypothetical protein [Bacteroidales bacterium]
MATDNAFFPAISKLPGNMVPAGTKLKPASLPQGNKQTYIS